jgi:hypothetical protein
MFAASPGLHAVEHPIYDVWLTDCKAPLVTAATQVETPLPAGDQAAQKPASPKKLPKPPATPQAAVPRR